MRFKMLTSFFLRQTALSALLGGSLIMAPVPVLSMEEEQEIQQYPIPLRGKDGNKASKEEEIQQGSSLPFQFLNPLIIKATQATADSFEEIKQDLSQTIFKDSAVFSSLRRPHELVEGEGKLTLAPLMKVLESLEKSFAESEEKVRSLLEKLILFYKEFEKKFTISSLEEQRKLSLPPVKMFLLGQPRALLIEQGMAYRLISADAYGYQMRTNAEGIHPVASVEGIHFKRHLPEPLMPGMETAMYHLHKRLSPNVINPSALIHLQGVKTLFLSKESELYQFIMTTCYEKKISPEELLKRNLDLKEKADREATSQEGDFFLQASRTILGSTLYELLESFEKKGDIKTLCTDESFSAFCLGSFLANPTDAKPGNLMVEEKTKNLIGIDNDRGFAEAIFMSQRRHYPAVKNILYFLGPLMETPVNVMVRERILAKSPLQFLREWLQDLREENIHYARNVSAEKQDQLSLPIRFVPGTLPEIYRKLCLLQSYLKEKEGVTHSELLRIIEPALSLFYQSAVAKTPLESYNNVYRPIAFEDVFNMEKAKLEGQSLHQVLSHYTQGLWDYVDKRTQSLEEAEKELLRAEGAGTELLKQALREKNKDLIKFLFSLGVGEPQEIIEALQTQETLLPCLDMSQMKLKDSHIMNLSKALAHHSSLREVYLKKNEISKASLADLSQGLKSHKYLTTLDLSNNRLLEIQQATPLKELFQLRRLNLSYTKLNDQGAIDLAKNLVYLTHFEAAATEISGSGAQSIVQNLKFLTFLNLSRTKSASGVISSLAQHSSLKELDLSHNRLSDEEASSLAKVLEKNPPLTSLNLYYNVITEKGTLSIAKALKLNQHLQLLHLGNNNAGDSGAKGMATSLEINQTLTSLNLSRNFIGDPGALNLSKSLIKNKALRVVDLTLNELTEEKKKEIEPLFSTRKELSLRL